eukprot:comp21037_c0_seq1/m.28269 comp21037_c0_seq1/g.28269  ORF comp21037_c0_seq1/g.28269 comp21037_c0_seq1/m.28269 type:complete len:344 (-) comp21037_c0_seq1:492-1523(-)
MEPPQLTPRAPKAAYGESDNSTAQPPSTIYLDDKQHILVTRSPPTAKFTQGAAGPKPRLRDALDRALEYMGTASGLVSAVWFGTTVLTVNIGTYYAVKALIPSGVTSAFDYFVHGAKDMGLSDAAIYAAMNMLGVFLLFSVFCVSAQRTVTRAVTERSYEYFASVNQLPRGTDVSAFEGSARLYAVFCGGGCCDLRTLVYLVLFNVMYYFMILIGLALLVVPGVIAAIGLSIAPAIIVVEGVGPITAISRCWALLREKKTALIPVLATVFVHHCGGSRRFTVDSCDSDSTWELIPHPRNRERVDHCYRCDLLRSGVFCCWVFVNFLVVCRCKLLSSPYCEGIL